jgi:hypothetical protein
MSEFRPGTVVIGPFFSDGTRGVGIVRERAAGTRSWRAVPAEYQPVEVLVGDRINGGYRPAALAAVPRVKEARR